MLVLLLIVSCTMSSYMVATRSKETQQSTTSPFAPADDTDWLEAKELFLVDAQCKGTLAIFLGTAPDPNRTPTWKGPDGQQQQPDPRDSFKVYMLCQQR